MTEVTAWVALDDADQIQRLHVDGARLAPVGQQHRISANSWKRSRRCRRSSRDGRCKWRVALSRRARSTSITPSPGTVRTTTQSDRPRRAIALHYMTNETFFVASGEHVMKAFVEVEDGEADAGPAFSAGVSRIAEYPWNLDVGHVRKLSLPSAPVTSRRVEGAAFLAETVIESAACSRSYPN